MSEISQPTNPPHPFELSDPVSRPQPRHWLRRLRPAIPLLFLFIVAWLFIDRFQDFRKLDIVGALLDYDGATLLKAGLLTALSYGLFTSYDLLARRHIGIALAPAKVSAIAFTCYSLTLSIGAWIGGLGGRFLLYSGQGVPGPLIGEVILFSTITNWLGYLLVSGSILLFDPPSFFESRGFGEGALRLIGIVLLTTVAIYILYCAKAKRREVTLKAATLRLPSTPMALLQVTIAALNWVVIGTVIWVLFQGKISYLMALSGYLFSGFVNLITHVPAGLGVTEAIFLTWFAGRLSAAPVIAALVIFRAIYYLVPLLLGTLSFIGLNISSRRRPTSYWRDSP